MILFENGKTYRVTVGLSPPSGLRVPFIGVEMAGRSIVFDPVVGKLDTGAFMTMLTFDTANILGITDPKAGHVRPHTAQAANGQDFEYYVHPVTVRVPSPPEEEILFVLEAGFAQELTRNLFGIDWLEHMCVAIDERQVHLLRD